jgi:hypothetical protein
MQLVGFIIRICHDARSHERRINFRYLEFPKSRLGDGGWLLFSSEPNAVSHYIFHAVYFVLTCCEEFYCFGAAEWKLG